MEVSFEADPVRLGTPTSLFSHPALFRGYRALVGGESFLVPTATDRETESGMTEPQLVIVENWTADLPP